MTTLAVTSVNSLFCHASTCFRIGSKFRCIRSTVFALSFGFVEGAVAIYLGAAIGLLPGHARSRRHPLGLVFPNPQLQGVAKKQLAGCFALSSAAGAPGVATICPSWNYRLFSASEFSPIIPVKKKPPHHFGDGGRRELPRKGPDYLPRLALS